MKNYDPNITWGTHTIEVTLQQWGYVGHIVTKRGGNCKGKSILDFDFEVEDGSVVESDCDFSYDEDTELFSATLKDESGNTLKVESDCDEFNDMIVGLRILDFVKESEE